MHVYNLTGIFLTQTIWFSIKALEQKKENTCLGPSSDQKVAARKYIVSHCKKKKKGGGQLPAKVLMFGKHKKQTEMTLKIHSLCIEFFPGFSNYSLTYNPLKNKMLSAMVPLTH